MQHSSRYTPNMLDIEGVLDGTKVLFEDEESLLEIKGIWGGYTGLLGHEKNDFWEVYGERFLQGKSLPVRKGLTEEIPTLRKKQADLQSLSRDKRISEDGREMQCRRPLVVIMLCGRKQWSRAELDAKLHEYNEYGGEGYFMQDSDLGNGFLMGITFIDTVFTGGVISVHVEKDTRIIEDGYAYVVSYFFDADADAFDALHSRATTPTEE